MFRLFQLDDNNELVLNKNEIRLHQPLRKIIERDKGSAGDHDGRKKYWAFKELALVYIVADLGSYPNVNGFTEEEAIEFAITEFKLGKDYKVDSELYSCIGYYRQTQNEDPFVKIHNELQKGLRASAKVLEKLNQKINKELSKLDGLDDIDISNEEDVGVKSMNTLLTYQDKIFATLDKIPNAVDQIDKLKARISKDKHSSRTGRGGTEIGLRADPK